MNAFINVHIDVDPKLCIFCGLCEVFCPFNAIKIRVDDKPLRHVVKNGTLPEVLKNVEIDCETCKRVNSLCERLCIAACPLDIITFNGSYVYVNDVTKCPTCKWCEAVCHSVIKVDKIFQGTVRIHNEKCPDGCKNCFYVCPVNAIYLDEDGKVGILDEFCILCGACKNFCPENEAIDISITHVKVCSIGSNAWKNLSERFYWYKPIQNKPAIQNADTQWPKIAKTNDEKKLKIERKAYLKRHTLELDKDLCKKCQICHIICPKGAINITTKH